MVWLGCLRVSSAPHAHFLSGRFGRDLGRFWGWWDCFVAHLAGDLAGDLGPKGSRFVGFCLLGDAAGPTGEFVGWSAVDVAAEEGDVGDEERVLDIV